MKTQWSKKLCDYLRAEYSADFEKGRLIHKRDNGSYWSTGDVQKEWRNKSKGSPYTYITTFVDGKKKSLKVFHVIWFLYYGKQADGFIDHIRGLSIPYPNAISNLREVQRSGNMLNSCIGRGKSGIRGVHIKLRGKFIVTVRGKRIATVNSKWEGYSIYCKVAKEALGEFYRPQLNPCNVWMVKPTHHDYKKFVLGLA